MGIVDVQFRTFTCDSCKKTITFENSQEGAAQAEIDAPWLKSTRFLISPDQRKFLYCGPLCLIAGEEAGEHDVKEKPKVEIPTGGAQAQIQAAAAAAKRAEEAGKALKAGQPVTIR